MALRLWVDVFDASNKKLNDGTIWLQDVSVRRVLDGVGTFNFGVPLTYTRARQWLTIERRVIVYREQVGAAPYRVLDGVIRSVSKRHAAGGWSLDVQGDELLTEMSYFSTLLNRRYVQQGFATAMTNLLAIAGWTGTISPTSSIVDARFDGTNVLKAMSTLCKNAGLHFRQGTLRNVEIGTFGATSGLTLTNPPQSNIKNPKIGQIESLSVVEESEKITNWVLPIGAGEGEAALTLEYSTRPFVKTMTGADGRPMKYISDDASVTAYGMKQATWTYKDIAPISNSQTGKVNASNQLADAAYAELQTTKQTQITYSVTSRMVAVTVRPGDLVRILYTGPIRRRDGQYLADERVDGMFYVTRIVEKSNADGTTYDYEVSNVNRTRQDTADLVATVLDEAVAKNYKPQPSAYRFQDTKVDTTVNATNPNIPVKPAVYRFEIDDTITAITRARLRIRTMPLYSWSRFSWSSTTLSANFNYFTVQHDTRYPVSLTLKIDGVDYTATFNGPFNAGNDVSLQVDVDLDITDILNAGTLYGVHTIEVQTGQAASFAVDFPGETANPVLSNYAHGLVEFTLKVLGVAQAIL